MLPIAITILLAEIPCHSSAARIIQPTAASTNLGSTGSALSINNIRNQSGLSANYTSLVTEFDDYFAVNPVHTQFGGNTAWLALEEETAGQVFLDLGSSLSVEALALWNGNDRVGISLFDLYADDDGAFDPGSGSILLGSFNASKDPLVDGGTNHVQTFAFAAKSTRYVIIDIKSTYGLRPSISEVAFVGVPEPPAITLFILLGSAVAARRRRASPNRL